MKFNQRYFSADGPGRLQRKVAAHKSVNSFVAKKSVPFCNTNFLNRAELLSTFISPKKAKGPERQQYAYGLKAGMTLGILAVQVFTDDEFLDLVVNCDGQLPPGKNDMPARGSDINRMFSNAAIWGLDLAPDFRPLVDEWGPQLSPELPRELVPNAFGFAVYAFFDAAEQLAAIDVYKKANKI